MIAVILGLFGLILLATSVGLFYHGVRKSAAERTLQRLGQLPEPVALQAPVRSSLELLLLRAGFDYRTDRFMFWGAGWLLLIALAGSLAGWPGAGAMLVLGPLLGRGYMSWRYHRRLRRMIEQLPTLLDHAVRSLKAGRTLNDAVREQGARQLRAMTGETRMTAMVLALLPICMVGYFMVANPGYLLSMWNNHSGQMMLLAAFILQVLGCVALWRMLRSI